MYKQQVWAQLLPGARRAVAAFIAAAIVFSGPLEVFAQDDANPKGDELKQRSIYIPYKKLRDVFEKEGRGVFLPYEQFQKLWKAAHRADGKPIEQAPPLPAVITETTNEATVEGDVVHVKAVVKIELLKKGWNSVPLRLDDAAITKATIKDQAARVVAEKGKGYQLLYETAGPETIELKLEYAKAITKAPGQNSVSFNSPQAPISKWRVTIPESGVKVNVHPLIAATEAPPPPEGEKQVTSIMAFVGAAVAVRIDWNPKSEGALGLAAIANVLVTQKVWIEEGVTRVRADLAYQISRAQLAALAVDVPADYKVIDVADANVRQWSVEAGAAQQIKVQLYEPAKGSQNLRIELERVTARGGDDAPAERALSVPAVKAVGVASQRGVVVVNAASDLRSKVSRSTGLIQVDAAELPAALRIKGSNWDFAYRYSTLPFELTLGIEKVQPQITATAFAQVHLESRELRVNHHAVYTIERAGVFQLEMNLPGDFEVLGVEGSTVNKAKRAAVDTFHTQAGENDEPDRLIVNLSQKAIGKVGLRVRLLRRLDHPELWTPSADAASIELSVPRAVSVERETGNVVVYAPESLRVSAGEKGGLRSVSASDAVKDFAMGAPNGTSPTMAFSYMQDAVKLTLSAKRRQPFVSVGQLLTARIEPGVVKYQATFNYDIRYSGVKAIRIDVPADLAASIHNTTDGIRERAIDPAPDAPGSEVAEGYVAWNFSGARELLGRVPIRLTWERKLDKLDVGKSVDISVPRLVPVGADRAWGQVVLAKAETIDVRPGDEKAVTGVRAIDPQHDLMNGSRVPGASRAFEFHDAWTLSVTATHYELEEVKRTSIERALVRMVVTRSDQVAVQALYRMRSARQRLLLELPAQVEFDTQPLRINGKPVSLERGDKGEFFVPLVGQSPDKAFVLELRYTAPAETASGNLEVPEFPDEPAVQKVYLSVYLPRERMLLGTGGPWSHEMDWHSAGPLKWNPVPRVNASGLYQWVVAGVNLSSNDSAHFQTDGHHYLYSTLSPDAAPDGSLSLVTMDETTVALLTFGLIVAGGLLLLKSGSSRRWSAAGVFVIAIVLVGVFAPTFSLQVMGRTTLWAVLVVGVVWTVWYVAYTRPRDPLVKARREARMQLAMGGSVVTTIPTTDGADKIEVEVESEEAPPPDDDQGSDHEGDDEGGKDDE